MLNARMFLAIPANNSTWFLHDRKTQFAGLTLQAKQTAIYSMRGAPSAFPDCPAH
jgi:hypothetical protein